MTLSDVTRPAPHLGGTTALRRERRRPGRRRLLLAALAAVVAATLVVPVPVFVFRPGSALPVAERLELGHPRDEVSGQLLLTTVSVAGASLAEVVAAWLDDDADVVRREVVVPGEADYEEHLEAQRRLFVETARVAAAVGLRAAGFAADLTGSGARVTAVLAGSPAEGALREGDVVVGVGGRLVGLASDLVAAVAPAGAGEAVTLEVRRGDEVQPVRLELEELGALGRPGLGVAVETVDPDVALPFPVEFDSGRIGGPSAGLMIALTVYDLVDEGDLTRGRVVAGTGTIDATGTVGPVGGVAQKVAAAVEAGAEVFVVPGAEATEAERAAEGKLRVVPVATLREAIAALGGNPVGSPERAGQTGS